MTYGMLLSVVSCLPARSTEANEGSVGLFIRGDSDSTTVISPRVGVSTTLGSEARTRVDAAYSADIWTSASIDIRTAATMPVTEQRDQIDLGVSHELGDVTFGGSYYFSTETDYDAHGAALRSSQELAGGSTTLEEQISVGHALVGRSGDAYFQRKMGTVGLRLVLTQIMDPKTLLQGVYEVSHQEGYLSNPYRYVGMGGDGQCGGTAVLCLPEAHPELRTRHAVAGQARHALSADSSAGLGYRFYMDDWGVVSHTAIAQIAWLPGEDQTLTLRYRYYQQTAANFYRSNYPMPVGRLRYITRDKELSPMFSNRLAMAYDTRVDLGGEVALKVGLALGGTIFSYNDFPGLSDVYAGDASIAFTLEL